MKGILPDNVLKEFVESGYITSPNGEKIVDQIQPTSLDLTLGERAWELRGEPTNSMPIDRVAKDDFSIKNGTILHPGKTYLIELNERFNPENFPSKEYDIEEIHIHANPKSSAGRTGMLSKLYIPGSEMSEVVGIGKHEYGEAFAIVNNHNDSVPSQYKGKLYVLVSPGPFPVKLKKGDSINQVRLYYGNLEESELDVRNLYEKLYKRNIYLVEYRNNKPVEKLKIHNNGIEMSMHLKRDKKTILEARKTSKPVLFERGANKLTDFFKIKQVGKDGLFTLKKDGFYIIGTRELFRLPTEETLRGSDTSPFAAEIPPYDYDGIGKARIHGAGFVEYGFGISSPSLIIMEVHPFSNILIEDGSPVGVLKLYKISRPPENSYNGSYNRQTLTPGKYFTE